MRILFICSTVEPGKDGVGDYTRRFCAEIIRQGHEAAIIGINDKQISGSTISDQKEDLVHINVLRLSSTLQWNDRIKQATLFLENFNPDWVSLQFVPYGFQAKGLPIGLASHLKKLGKGLRWHIMFHELWVGVNSAVSFKNRIYGTLQRLLIRQLIRQLKPGCITTSIACYQRRLPSQAQLLRLFGNIPIVDGECNSANEENIVVVHFGTFSSQLSDLRAQLNYIKAVATAANKAVIFRVFGNGGPYQSQAVSIAEKLLGPDAVEVLGRLTEKEISKQFLHADLGISRANFDFYGKSGSTIAMLEHGLPVVLRGPAPGTLAQQDKYINDEQLVFPTGSNNLPAKRGPNRHTVADTARLLIHYLSKTL